MLSNSLAINSGASASNSKIKPSGWRKLLSNDGFPEWVRLSDRKLLQTSSSAASQADIYSSGSRWVWELQDHHGNRQWIHRKRNDIRKLSRTTEAPGRRITIRFRPLPASDLKPVQALFKTYLGRPWQQYSRTVFMKTDLDSLIDPAGWLEWSGDFALSTLCYGEYMNTGAGASTTSRVRWPGFHVMSAIDAAKFTVGSFIPGGSWIPATGVPFTAGL
ncbi:Pectinesterase 2 [Acorus gramineus]|uniref:Pectinesterase 2 n=1 Tax=Acorus gramineus TaxID=55184 RepID=A0AAV9BM16_ACOGR|nr:Pectinesterase 2 [Acorus gramineus]